jgi:hypothetical protein
MTTKKRGSSPSGHEKAWPVTMAEAVFIARIRYPDYSDAKIAADYGIDEAVVREIRTTRGYNGVNLW